MFRDSLDFGFLLEIVVNSPQVEGEPVHVSFGCESSDSFCLHAETLFVAESD